MQLFTTAAMRTTDTLRRISGQRHGLRTTHLKRMMTKSGSGSIRTVYSSEAEKTKVLQQHLTLGSTNLMRVLLRKTLMNPQVLSPRRKLAPRITGPQRMA